MSRSPESIAPAWPPGPERPPIPWRPLVAIVVVILLAAPAVLDRASFPLSTYPMYSRTRGEVVAVATANGVDLDGGAFRLSLPAIGDIDDPLIVEALLRQTIRDGPEAVAALCNDIAGRVAPSDRYRTVEVVTERHDVVAFARGKPSLVDREVHTTCEVPG